MRYKVNLAYNGTNYVGFQKQKNGLAIQEVIEERLKIVLGSSISIVMASRTDSGVHAYGQVFHFDFDRKLEPYKLKGSLNALLPKDVHINQVEMVDDDFHARFDVVSKVYEYRINIGDKDIFLNDLSYYCPFELDLEAILKALPMFEGEHDFGSFNTCSYATHPNQVRNIYRFELQRQANQLIFEIEGNGFLRHMVRMIIGTMIDLGRGKKSLEDVKRMLDEPSKSHRRFNIDPHGLYLKTIYY